MKRLFLLIVGLLFLWAGSVLAFSAGTKTDVDGTAAPLSATSTLILDILIQADPDNSEDVFVGDSTSQTIQLRPADAIYLQVNNLNVVYVKTGTGPMTVNWLSR